LSGDDADAVQAPRDTSNLDRGRDFDVEGFSEMFPDAAAEMRQRPQRDYDEQRAAWNQKEEERKRKEDRGGIMSQVGSALSSDKAQKFYSAMQDLSYGGGAARGQEGTQMMRGLAARDAQNRELQTLEDRVGLQREMLELEERIAEMGLTDSIFGTDGFQQYVKNLADEAGVSISDENLLATAMRNYRRLLGTQAMPGLDTTSPAAEAKAYLNANP
jgi:hypothetical protein